jgi:hypothetical protein
VLFPVQVSGSSAEITLVQAPVVQLWHAPAHAALQHLPSAQKPLAHWLTSVHTSPTFRLHAPAASQVFAPLHESGSSAPMTGTHAPVAQLWHTAPHATGQQRPSGQKPEAHCVPAVHT